MAGNLKTATLRRGPKGFGFTLAEQYPCYLSNVHSDGVADNAGFRAGDQLVAVGNVDVCRLPHSEIVDLLADSGNKLTLSVRSKKPALKPQNSSNGKESEEILSKKVANNSQENRQDEHWTDHSSMDSDSSIWRQQKMGAECRLQAGSLRRHQQSAGASLTAPYAVVNPINAKISSKSGANSYSNFEYINGGGQRKKNRKSRMTRQYSTTALWQQAYPPEGRVYANSNSTNYYENSLPSSLRGRRGRSASKRSSGNLQRKGGHYSSSREIRGNMNRSVSEPDFLAEDYPKKSSSKNRHPKVESSMIAHADSGSSDLSSDDSENDENHRDRSVTTSESENTSNDSTGIVVRLEKDESMIFQSVVVYIGAVPVPNNGKESKRQHVIRSALQSLRAQHAKARTVLLQVLADQVVVTNSRGSVTHRLLISRIAFATACAENKQYFGLCTIHPQESSVGLNSPNTTKSSNSTENSENSDFPTSVFSVCHMFAADPQLHLHSFHYNYAKKFGIVCSRDPETGCLEFPYIRDHS